MRLHAVGDMAANQRGRDRAAARTLRSAAEAAARVALEKAWRQGDRRIGLYALALLALTALKRGDPRRAGRLWGGVVAESDGGDVVPADDDFRQVTEPLCAADDPAFAAGLETGRAGLLDDAVAFALTAR